jgi:steroid 5-alpha reductase family enzyme
MTIMFFTASIPIAEKRSAERRPGWAEYAARTPLILPRLGSTKTR